MDTGVKSDLSRLFNHAYTTGQRVGRRDALIDLRGMVAAAAAIGVFVGIIIGLMLTGWL